ncbi:hypothetical protein VUR80DRAFT_5468 [Thermomyces stellatus]
MEVGCKKADHDTTEAIEKEEGGVYQHTQDLSEQARVIRVWPRPSRPRPVPVMSLLPEVKHTKNGALRGETRLRGVRRPDTRRGDPPARTSFFLLPPFSSGLSR